MNIETFPDVAFNPAGEFASDDLADFIESMAIVEDDVPLFWLSNRDQTARPGLWLRVGFYRHKHGSFVDPFDLSAYAAQYYVADDGGRHRCLQIGHGLEGPDDAVAVETMGQFRAAVAALVPSAVAAMTAASTLVGAADTEAEDAGVGDAGEQKLSALGDGEGQETSAPADAGGQWSAASAAGKGPAGAEGSLAESVLRLLQPDGAFELHGSLTTGWRAEAYTTADENGHETVILVFD